MISMIDQWIKEAFRGGITVAINYPESFFKAKKEAVAFIKYNTGDCLWFDYINGEYKVVQINTDDDLHIYC